MNKREQLQNKKQIKMSLRDHSHIKFKKFIQYDQQQFLTQIQYKSKRWWQKVNQRYFQQFNTIQDFQQKKQQIEKLTIQPQVQTYKQNTYFSKNISIKNPKLFERKNIKVLFQIERSDSGDFHFMTYYFSIFQQLPQSQQSYEEQFIIQNENNQRQNQFKFEGQPLPQNIKVSYLKKQSQSPQQYQIQQKQIKQISLLCNKGNTDINILNQCLMYQLTQGLNLQSQIDKQIYLWQQQLQNVQNQNQKIWTMKLQKYEQEQSSNQENQMLKQIKNGYNIQQNVVQIKQKLQWQHNLINIRNGFTDKTIQMLAQALQGMWVKQNQSISNTLKKKFYKSSLSNLILTKAQLTGSFETDCKVCFSTYVSEKNKVIYCDQCNESFHEKCYGIENLNEDPQSKYFCDYCLQINQNKNSVVECSICHIPFSPIKKFGKYFFHLSCLYLNNMLLARTGQFIFKDNLTEKDIVSKVKQFQQNHRKRQCQFCTDTCKKGLRFRCSEPGCKKYFHTLCAYLNSAVFQVWREKDKLSVKIKCPEHFQNRQLETQTFLRRFFCNYKGTSNLSENQFIQIYKEEVQQKNQYKRQRKLKKLLKDKKKEKKEKKEKERKQIDQIQEKIKNKQQKHSKIPEQKQQKGKEKDSQKQIKLQQKIKTNQSSNKQILYISIESDTQNNNNTNIPSTPTVQTNIKVIKIQKRNIFQTNSQLLKSDFQKLSQDYTKISKSPQQIKDQKATQINKFITYYSTFNQKHKKYPISQDDINTFENNSSTESRQILLE